MAGSQCCENPPELSGGGGGSVVESFGGLRAYVAGFSDSKLAVLFISDVFGINSSSTHFIFFFLCFFFPQFFGCESVINLTFRDMGF